MTLPVLYGVPNCDTVKRARAWLNERGVEHRFHDFRKDGLDAAQLARWSSSAGWETLLNRRGTTWRKLSEAERASVHDEATALALMQAHPTLVKRPVVEWPGGALTVGFSEATYLPLVG